MKRRYMIADVFTDIPLQGNPAAVVLDCEGLSTEQMQSITAEFGYTETTLVFPPRDPPHTVQVRIFTLSREIPFAGHPNIGTVFVLATKAAEAGEPLPGTLVFDEAAGVVPVRQLMEDITVVGGELVVPEQLSLRSEVAAESVAAYLSLDAKDIQVDIRRPIVALVGLPLLIVELCSRDALRRCAPNPVACKATSSLGGAVFVYAYTRDIGDDGIQARCDLQSRMFTSRMTEDPATGSTVCATVVLLAATRSVPELMLRARQGVDMGHPSTLVTSCEKTGDTSTVHVGGKCVAVMEGTFWLPALR